MLILSQDETKILNVDHVARIDIVGNSIVCIDRTGIALEVGTYCSSDAAKHVFHQIMAEYAAYFKVEGGMMAATNNFVQPMMVTPPKVYKMPKYEVTEKAK